MTADRIDLAALRADFDAHVDEACARWGPLVIRAVLAAAGDGLVCGYSFAGFVCGDQRNHPNAWHTEDTRPGHDFLPAVVLPVIPEEADDE